MQDVKTQIQDLEIPYDYGVPDTLAFFAPEPRRVGALVLIIARENLPDTFSLPS